MTSHDMTLSPENADLLRRRYAAARFVQLTHMCDWIWNEERQQIAARLGLHHHWQAHAAYLEARSIAGMEVSA